MVEEDVEVRRRDLVGDLRHQSCRRQRQALGADPLDFEDRPGSGTGRAGVQSNIQCSIAQWQTDRDTHYVDRAETGRGIERDSAVDGDTADGQMEGKRTACENVQRVCSTVE